MVLETPGSSEDNMASQAEINLTKGVIRWGKRPFRHEFNILGLLGSIDICDVAPNKSEDDSAGCRVNMQDSE